CQKIPVYLDATLAPFALDGIQPRFDLRNLLNVGKSLLERVYLGVDRLKPSINLGVHGFEPGVYDFLELSDLLVHYQPYLGLEGGNQHPLDPTRDPARDT